MSPNPHEVAWSVISYTPDESVTEMQRYLEQIKQQWLQSFGLPPSLLWDAAPNYSGRGNLTYEQWRQSVADLNNQD